MVTFYPRNTLRAISRFIDFIARNILIAIEVELIGISSLVYGIATLADLLRNSINYSIYLLCYGIKKIFGEKIALIVGSIANYLVFTASFYAFLAILGLPMPSIVGTDLLAQLLLPLVYLAKYAISSNFIVHLFFRFTKSWLLDLAIDIVLTTYSLLAALLAISDFKVLSARLRQYYFVRFGDRVIYDIDVERRVFRACAQQIEKVLMQVPRALSKLVKGLAQGTLWLFALPVIIISNAFKVVKFCSTFVNAIVKHATFALKKLYALTPWEQQSIRQQQELARRDATLIQQQAAPRRNNAARVSAAAQHRQQQQLALFERERAGAEEEIIEDSFFTCALDQAIARKDLQGVWQYLRSQPWQTSGHANLINWNDDLKEQVSTSKYIQTAYWGDLTTAEREIVEATVPNSCCIISFELMRVPVYLVKSGNSSIFSQVWSGNKRTYLDLLQLLNAMQMTDQYGVQLPPQNPETREAIRRLEDIHFDHAKYTAIQNAVAAIKQARNRSAPATEATSTLGGLRTSIARRFGYGT